MDFKWEFWSEALLYVFCLIFIEEKEESWYTGTKAKRGDMNHEIKKYTES